MSADGLTPEIVERVSAWARAQPDASDLANSLVVVFEREADIAFGFSKADNPSMAQAHEAAALGCLLRLVLTAIGSDVGLRLDIAMESVFDERPTSARVLDGCISVGRSDGGSIANALTSLLTCNYPSAPRARCSVPFGGRAEKNEE